jgi:hypothetical protein
MGMEASTSSVSRLEGINLTLYQDLTILQVVCHMICGTKTTSGSFKAHFFVFNQRLVDLRLECHSRRKTVFQSVGLMEKRFERGVNSSKFWSLL